MLQHTPAQQTRRYSVHRICAPPPMNSTCDTLRTCIAADHRNALYEALMLQLQQTQRYSVLAPATAPRQHPHQKCSSRKATRPSSSTLMGGRNGSNAVRKTTGARRCAAT